ncbi:pyrroline-5-carboxylate reductase [Conidiobolus coronatus NRRL 28638]|uniref:Pyrroline-5-carboxylate reductase n=1 Tax=Conidiobolus coronatus (strain ATCC 28846 / CBS 209.66 / NRRL 28638) TaxID=796925 RepID=A0A137PBJ8_CONC2|nr:pyrroline-5-carboxylate reductase [Conidiobolus coronatus NRRL 28638]|eukprot:KXN72374.1 pyrroline-5-carboxylate reductase [Conidiobolus coronatus NRRL 28638]
MSVITSLLKKSSISFVGGGNVAKAVIGGLRQHMHPSQIVVCEPDLQRAEALKKELGVRIKSDSQPAFSIDSKPVDAVVLAVKPDVIKTILTGDLGKEIIENKPLLLSVAAGVQMSSYRKWLASTSDESKASQIPLVRTMPNTPCLVNFGAIGIYGDSTVTEKHKSLVDAVLQSVSAPKGLFWLNKEEHLDVVTAVSGSGPAYFFYMIELIEKEAVRLGLPGDVARSLAASTAIGSGMMLFGQNFEKLQDPEQLRKNVTSPNGTTHAAIEAFKKANFGNAVEQGIQACVRRSKELAQTLKD